jgi:hypothetical protein
MAGGLLMEPRLVLGDVEREPAVAADDAVFGTGNNKGGQAFRKQPYPPFG